MEFCRDNFLATLPSNCQKYHLRRPCFYSPARNPDVTYSNRVIHSNLNLFYFQKQKKNG